MGKVTMDDYRDFAEDIAPAAASLYGQEWVDIDYFTRQRWIDAVRDAKPNAGQTAMEQACGKAIAIWQASQAQTATAAPIEAEADEEDNKPKGKSKK